MDTCRAWADALARERGDTLTEAEADSLALFAFFCRLDRAVTHGLEEIPEE